jgi:dihydropteroate synthase
MSSGTCRSPASFVDWGEVFNDQILATAILDRLLHHATTVNIKGDSYRLREKKLEPLTARSFWQVLRLHETALRTD